MQGLRHWLGNNHLLKIAVNHDVAAFHYRFEIVFTTPEAPVFSLFAILRGFLTD